jgi:hypothetical protein
LAESLDSVFFQQNPVSNSFDEELDRVLSLQVREPNGGIISAITTWNEGRDQVFKCWICKLQVGSVGSEA